MEECNMVFNGKGMIWDAESQDVLCKFDERGLFVTDDVKIIAKLEKLGYKGKESTKLVQVLKETGAVVNWKDKYEAEHATRLALESEYEALKAKYEAFADTVDVPITVATVEEAIQEGEEELEAFYVLGDYKLKKDINTEKISTLRNLLKDYDALQGIPYMKLTKVKAVELTYQLLDKKGLLK